jgi:hypothetical protein
MSVTHIHILGGDPEDDCYGIDFGEGEITWNATRALRAATKGEFGPPRTWTGAFPAIDGNAIFNCERAKIDFFKTRPDILKIPVIAVEGDDVGPDTVSILCFIDGNHRMMAMSELQYQSFRFYLVPRDREKEFRITFIRMDL